MLPFDVTILATVPQRLEIPEGLMNYSVYEAQEVTRCFSVLNTLGLSVSRGFAMTVTSSGFVSLRMLRRADWHTYVEFYGTELTPPSRPNSLRIPYHKHLC